MNIYEKNLDKNIANYSTLSPLSFLERTRKVFPDNIAIEYDDYKLTYKDAANRCDALAGMLKKFGVKQNETVAVMLPNIPQMWESHFGIPMIGAVLNAINTRLDASTISFILNHGEAKVFIYDSSYSEIVILYLLPLFFKSLSCFELLLLELLISCPINLLNFLLSV